MKKLTKSLIIFLGVFIFSFLAFSDTSDAYSIIPAKDIVSTYAPTRTWDFSAYASYCDITLSDMSIVDVVNMGNNTYRVKAKLSLTYNYPGYPYNVNEDAEFYVTNGRITRIVYAPNNQWSRTEVTISYDSNNKVSGEVWTKGYSSSNYSYNSTTVISYDSAGHIVKKEGTEVSKSSWSGTSYESTNHILTTIDGNTTTTITDSVSIQNGVQTGSSHNETVITYDDNGFIIANINKYDSTYANSTYSGSYAELHNPDGTITYTSSYVNSESGIVTYKGEYSYTYASDWTVLAYYNENTWLNSSIERYDFSADGQYGEGEGLVRYSFHGSGESADYFNNGELTVTNADGQENIFTVDCSDDGNGGQITTVTNNQGIVVLGMPGASALVQALVGSILAATGDWVDVETVPEKVLFTAQNDFEDRIGSIFSKVVSKKRQGNSNYRIFLSVAQGEIVITLKHNNS